MAKKQKKLEEISKKFGEERQKALDAALKNIEKDFGKGAIMRLGEGIQWGGLLKSMDQRLLVRRP